ncbi:DEAD-box ATP-dependent RNA helicase [Trifolium repens]|nr:DEAD-box ATP-dependent RNA helicase [Trifolium repens]
MCNLELAIHVSDEFEALDSDIGVKCAMLVGGIDMVQQSIKDSKASAYYFLAIFAFYVEFCLAIHTAQHRITRCRLSSSSSHSKPLLILSSKTVSYPKPPALAAYVYVEKIDGIV